MVVAKNSSAQIVQRQWLQVRGVAAASVDAWTELPALLIELGLDCKPMIISSARYACAFTFHYLQDFAECRHGCVARRGHGKRTMGRPAFHGPLRILSGKEPVDQAGGKGISAADTVIDFEVLTVRSLIKLAIVVANCAPIIACGGRSVPQGGCVRCQLRKFPYAYLRRLVDPTL